MNAAWIDTIRLSLLQQSTFHHWARGSRPGIQFVELSSARVRMRVGGDGPSTSVFVADPPNVIEHYDTLCEMLTPFARVLCFEAPGFGFSLPKVNYSFTLAQQTKTVAELLEKVDIGPYTLAFSCATVYVAPKVAEELPHLVKKLVLMQAPSWEEEVLWNQRIDPHGWMHIPVFSQLAFPTQKRAISQSWYGVAVGKRNALPHFLMPCLNALEHGAWNCLPSLLQGLFAEREPLFGTVHQPALVLWGGADRSHGRPRNHHCSALFLMHSCSRLNRPVIFQNWKSQSSLCNSCAKTIF